MNNHFDENWKILKQVKPPASKKEAIRNRITHSISNKTKERTVLRIFEWKNVMLTSLFLLISAGILFQLQYNYQKKEAPDSSASKNAQFTWNAAKIYGEESEDGYAFFKEGSSIPVGYADIVTEEEQKKITSTGAMYVEKELEHFPYPTTLYIEHVKMTDVSLRYHFFVKAENKTTHFSFDFPKLEYAEIFNFIATLKYKNQKPYIHDEQLYATHGYDTLPFPVGLNPVEKNGHTEKYIWENASLKEYNKYLNKIRSTGEWEEKSMGDSSHIFTSVTGYEVVKITLNGKRISYEFTYPEQGE
ncbi:hypothetical protein AABM38_12370 [Heyndrickxia sp. MSNUG]|uniref:hypothetical protein n=1 Tax=Heyndrickxia sp. MSNUG TaxID=3136677 RepID=UPI003C2FFFA3